MATSGADTATLVRVPASAETHRPCLRAVIRRVGLSLLIACAVPATVFYVCLRLEGVWVAIFAALAWSYGAIAWRAVTRRRTSGLLILTAVVMTARTLIALATDSTYLYFLQPIISDGLIGLTFLVSMGTARPMVARLAGDFYPMDDELHVRPRIRRLFWYLTLGWAMLCIGKATMTLWLLQSQSLQTFVLVKSVSVLLLNALAVAATIGAAVLVARREGLLAEPLVPATQR
jgi:intracellular septation protein A